MKSLNHVNAKVNALLQCRHGAEGTRGVGMRVDVVKEGSDDHQISRSIMLIEMVCACLSSIIWKLLTLICADIASL